MHDSNNLHRPTTEALYSISKDDHTADWTQKRQLVVNKISSLMGRDSVIPEDIRGVFALGHIVHALNEEGNFDETRPFIDAIGILLKDIIVRRTLSSSAGAFDSTHLAPQVFVGATKSAGHSMAFPKLNTNTPTHGNAMPPTMLPALGSPVQLSKHKTWIAGVSFNSNNGTSRQGAISALKPGDLLDLRWDHENDFDNNAVSIHDEQGSQLGFVQKVLAPTIWSHIVEYDRVHAVVLDITGQGRGILGCRIEVIIERSASASENFPFEDVSAVGEDDVWLAIG